MCNPVKNMCNFVRRYYRICSKVAVFLLNLQPRISWVSYDVTEVTGGQNKTQLSEWVDCSFYLLALCLVAIHGISYHFLTPVQHKYQHIWGWPPSDSLHNALVKPKNTGSTGLIHCKSEGVERTPKVLFYQKRERITLLELNQLLWIYSISVFPVIKLCS